MVVLHIKLSAFGQFSSQGEPTTAGGAAEGVMVESQSLQPPKTGIPEKQYQYP
jgi:hypothetical protein